MTGRSFFGAQCRYCGSAATWLTFRFEPKPAGSYSIAGAQEKVVGQWWPHLECGGCGHVSRGQADTP